MPGWSAYRSVAFRVLPWIITAAALYYAFHGIDLSVLLSHVHEVKFEWFAAALILTSISYILRFSLNIRFRFSMLCGSCFSDSS